MRLFRACLVSLASASIDLPRDWQAQHCRGTHLEQTGETVVALATDASRGFLPIIGVVNSTVHNSNSDVGFVIVTTRVHFLKRLLDRFFPSLRVAVCSGAAELLRDRPALGRLSSLANSTNIKRKELLSPFNFAAFYMPHVLYHTRRVIYLDTDIVVQGDVLELATLDLHNKAVAAVNDCSQKIAKYFDEKLLPIQHKILWQRVLRGDGCVFNRGVVVFDTLRWRTLQLTETIEDLVDAFVDSKAQLWSSGISQPPFLLALAGRYEQLPVSWNVRGLGRFYTVWNSNFGRMSARWRGGSHNLTHCLISTQVGHRPQRVAEDTRGSAALRRRRVRLRAPFGARGAV